MQGIEADHLVKQVWRRREALHGGQRRHKASQAVGRLERLLLCTLPAVLPVAIYLRLTLKRLDDVPVGSIQRHR